MNESWLMRVRLPGADAGDFHVTFHLVSKSGMMIVVPIGGLVKLVTKVEETF